MLRHGFSVLCAFSALLVATGLPPRQPSSTLPHCPAAVPGLPWASTAAGRLSVTYRPRRFLYSGGTVVNNIGAQLGGGTTPPKQSTTAGKSRPCWATSPLRFTTPAARAARQRIAVPRWFARSARAYGIDANGDVVGFRQAHHRRQR